MICGCVNNVIFVWKGFVFVSDLVWLVVCCYWSIFVENWCWIFYNCGLVLSLLDRVLFCGSWVFLNVYW